MKRNKDLVLTFKIPEGTKFATITFKDLYEKLENAGLVTIEYEMTPTNKEEL